MNDDPLKQILLNKLTPGEYKERILDFHSNNLEAFKTYPASADKHHCYAGGYYEHVLEVCNNIQTILPLVVMKKCANTFTIDDVFVAAYFHDIDKACSLVPEQSYRYKYDTEAATQKQISYALELGITLDPDGESKTTISYKIDCVKDGKEIDPFKVPHFLKKRDLLPVEDAAMVISICAHNNIVLSDEVVSATCGHHGGWSSLARNGSTISPLGVLLHLADMTSAFLQNGESLR